MKRKHIIAAALIAGALLLSSCGEVGRYQMVVTPPDEGYEGGYYWDTECYVLDTKTGKVWWHRSGPVMMSWDPANKTLRIDSMAITDETK